ncbi:hypothetical protein J5N97_010240 [Dioscorea zingiberensis]|uniref:COBW domain-containing protein 1 n=1 Tax=Dioscorea zingiberensis TaxID=325984 RepID=A0A9D5D0X0_9LILI|nr:hypothetical protein J5N97_010240 [Dioscorea zingiberensis]
MDDDDCPPLAVEIGDASEIHRSESYGRSENSPGISLESPVGVTVITGYLGAGKSTLVNHVLTAQHGKRIAVILNEFGEEIGVERAMINEGDSGLADPAGLISILWLDDQLESSVKLDSVITVVDAKNLRLQLDEHRNSTSFPEAFLQIAFADVVILNKVDLVCQEDCGSLGSSVIEDLEKKVHNINSLATIIPSVRCQVDLDKLLGRQAYGTNRLAHLESLLEDHKSVSAKSRHDYTVRTLCFYEQEPVDLAKVHVWLEDLLWEKKTNMDIYRCKGILNIHNSDQLHTLQVAVVSGLGQSIQVYAMLHQRISCQFSLPSYNFPDTSWG